MLGIQTKAGAALAIAGVLVAFSAAPPVSAAPFQSTLAGREIAHWASLGLPEWETRGKVTAPRILLAKSVRGREIEAVNSYLREVRPWADVGSSWVGHRGDYDFTLVTLIPILYQFGGRPDRLYPDTREHLLSVLLTATGGEPRLSAPKSLGTVPETENHILMTEGSRYLTNQWLHRRGTRKQRKDPRLDNRANGLEAWLSGYLRHLLRDGFYEFNSRPYMGYTIQALLNLEAYAEAASISERARSLLDALARRYAWSSLDLRREVPFRRQTDRRGETSLDQDPLTAYMSVWTDGLPGGWEDQKIGRRHFRIIAATLPYRPDERILRLAREGIPDEYLARHGNPSLGSPEIFSGGPGYLLAGGGVRPSVLGSFAVVPRPTVLLLNDGATDLSQCFRIVGKGRYSGWNQTGIAPRFAVGRGSVETPAGMGPAAVRDGWRVFAPTPSGAPVVAVYGGANFGILALFPEEDRSPSALADALVKANPEDGRLSNRFVRPSGGSVSYRLDPDDRLGLVTHINGEAVLRDYRQWPNAFGEEWIASISPDLAPSTSLNLFEREP